MSFDVLNHGLARKHRIAAESAASAATAQAVLAQGYAAQLAAGTASPAGTYANLEDLNAGTPTAPDVTKIYITLDDGKWCYHNGAAWVAGGQFQAASVVGDIANLSSQLADIAKYVPINLFDLSKANDGYRLDVIGAPIADATYTLSDYIPVTAGCSYRCVRVDGRIAGYNSSKVFTSLLTADTPPDGTFTATSTGFVRVSGLLSKKAEIMVADVRYYDGQYHAYGVTGKLQGDGIAYPALAPNPLYGKKVIGFGDSIASGGNNSNVGYAEIIALRNRMAVVNYAVSGATIRVVIESTNNVLKQVTDATETNADYLLMNGYTNDAVTTVTDNALILGAVSAGYAAALDTSTFCGAFEATLKLAISKWPSAKKLYVTAHRNGNRDVGAQETLHSLVVQMCSKWSIPVVDIYNDCNLNSFLAAYAAYTDAAGTHPNGSGYETFYVPLIEAKLRSS